MAEQQQQSRRQLCDGRSMSVTRAGEAEMNEGSRPGSRGESGFTLIELLVVTIILGILAAIAIPAFLQHRAKAWDAAVRSDLRSAATAQETYLTDADPGPYATTIPDLIAVGFRPSPGVNYSGGALNMSVTAQGALSYCLTAQSASGTYFALGSSAGWHSSTTPIDPITCL
jgi:type IV pilus assembly protein PilA